MKKVLILLILIVFSKATIAQTYEKLIDNIKLWSIIFDLTAENMSSYSVYVKFTDDTIIGTNHCSKILYTNDTTFSSWIRIGYVREDSVQKKVYIIDNSFNEGLLYDFSLNKNDTVNIFNTIMCHQPMQMIVDSVDTVLFAGKNRKRIFFNNTYFGTTIEGIGSTVGVAMNGRCMTGGIYKLLCYQKNDTILYQNPIYNDCNVTFNPPWWDGINLLELENDYFIIKPNPTIDKLTIISKSLDLKNKIIILIYDIQGQLLFSQTMHQNKTHINISMFDRGVYLMRLIGEDINVVKKIIKE